MQVKTSPNLTHKLMPSVLTVTARELYFQVGMLAQCFVILKDICQAYQSFRFVTTDIDNRTTEYYCHCTSLRFAYTLNYCAILVPASQKTTRRATRLIRGMNVCISFCMRRD